VTRRELEPGFGEPTTPEEVEHLLHLVPEIAFMPELQACVPSHVTTPVTTETIDAEADVATIRLALQELRIRAHLENRGGLRFLARTLLHFVDEIPPSQHPLVVALFLRAEAAAGCLDDTPAALSRAMDRF
jgi:hypothetical protein